MPNSAASGRSGIGHFGRSTTDVAKAASVFLALGKTVIKAKFGGYGYQAGRPLCPCTARNSLCNSAREFAVLSQLFRELFIDPLIVNRNGNSVDQFIVCTAIRQEFDSSTI